MNLRHFCVSIGLSIGAVFLLVPSSHACPLEGAWDTGYMTTNGQGFNRFIMEFECDGSTVLKSYNTRGMLIRSVASVVERVGEWKLGQPSQTLPGATTIDIVIKKLTMRYFDPASIGMVHRRNLTCGTTETRILQPIELAGTECNGTKWPPLGYIERAVFQIKNSTLLWSQFYGDEALVIQAPDEAVLRHHRVDVGLPFFKIVD